MGKYSKGVKVRDPDGEEATIIGKESGGYHILKYGPELGYSDGFTMTYHKSELEVVANDNEVSACAPVFEKEYSVGDRVRVKTRDYGETQFGKTGAVVEVNRPSSLSIGIEYDEPLTPGGLTRNQYMPDDLEPIEPAAAPTPTFTKGDRALSQNGDYVTVDTDPDGVGHVWVSFGTTKWRTPVSWLTKWEPKVGDRVRVASESNIFRVGTPAGCEGTITRVYSGAGVDLDLEHPRDGVIGQTCHDYQRYLEPLPVAEHPAAEPAPLVVEAGKFYRTRDGQKVGPMVAQDGAWPFWGPSDAYEGRCNFLADGTAPYLSQYDLVAEWGEPVDLKEEVESGRMSVNQARERIGLDPLPEPAAPPAKFKVGDRVTLTAPARISGFDKKNAMVLLETGGSFALPIASLIAA